MDLAPQSYPPESNLDLKNLHYEIISSSSPDHHKLSVLYYLMRDISQSGHGNAEDFAKASYLPSKYKIFVDGIWYLDRLKFEVLFQAHVIPSLLLILLSKRALDYLTEPALTPTFAEEILYTLCRHTPQNDVTLPIAYYHTVSPSITSSKVLEAYFLTLSRASVTEAFYFSRAQGELNHRFLFENLVAFVHAKSIGPIKATRGVELISLPMNDEEESWFNAVLEGGGKLPGAADTLVMRNIATGRPSPNAQHQRNRSGSKIDGVNWQTLKSSN